jgi:peptide/nickel transport system ATP-binding protein
MKLAPALSTRPPAQPNAALRADGLVVEVPTPSGWRAVVRGISLTLQRGQITALVGETGSGKTMTALALIGLLPSGARRRVAHVVLGTDDITGLTAADMSRVRGHRISMIFQDPMTALNPVLSIGFQVEEPMRVHLGLDARAAHERARELLAQLRLPNVDRTLRRYPHELSGGMRQRVLIAIALACDPQVLLADEPTTALDVTVQSQILDLLREQVDQRGLAVLLVTHDLGVAAQVAENIDVMYGGAIVESGAIEDVLTAPTHPYTRGLVGCIPRVDVRLRPLPTLPGSAHGVWDIPAGCRFATRCASVTERCRVDDPALEPVGDGHTAAWWVFAPGTAVARG